MPMSENPLESLSDPNPPTAGRPAREAVRRRAGILQRRRRSTQAAGALACTAILAIGAVALVNSGDTSGGGAGSVDAAAAPDAGTQSATPAPTKNSDGIAPAVAASTVVPAADETASAARTETPGTTVAPAQAAEVVTLGSVSVTVTGVPEGVTLNVQLVGDGGTFVTATGGSTVHFVDVPPGAYQVRWDWSSTDGATAAGRQAVTVVAGDNTFTI
jgi:hypothetical protein